MSVHGGNLGQHRPSVSGDAGCRPKHRELDRVSRAAAAFERTLGVAVTPVLVLTGQGRCSGLEGRCGVRKGAPCVAARGGRTL